MSDLIEKLESKIPNFDKIDVMPQYALLRDRYRNYYTSESIAITYDEKQGTVIWDNIPLWVEFDNIWKGNKSHIINGVDWRYSYGSPKIINFYDITGCLLSIHDDKNSLESIALFEKAIVNWFEINVIKMEIK